MEPSPNHFHKIGFSLNDPTVALLPYVPYEEAGDELSKSIENGVFGRMQVPILDGVGNVSSVSISSLTK